jgi:predicted DNA-binding protein
MDMASPKIGPPGKQSRRAAAATPVIGLRLSDALLERLAAYAEEHGITRSVAIRRLISQGLDRG